MNRLIGAVKFTRSSSLLSRIVRLGGIFSKHGKFLHPFQYSHCELVFEDNGKLYVLRAVPPKIIRVPLEEAENPKEQSIIKYLSSDSFNHVYYQKERFSELVKSYIGQDYSISSAIASALDKPIEIQDKKGNHCSFIVSDILQKIYVINKDFNCKEAVPDDVLYAKDKFNRSIFID
jgi:hypothetical protein